MSKKLRIPSFFALFVINALAWLAVHLIISHYMLKLDTQRINRFAFLYRSCPFEQEGALWDRLFNIKKWKGRLPESTTIVPDSFDQSAMGRTDPETLLTYIDETNRAELTHWVSMLPAPTFFLWNPKSARGIHILYALSSNVPFIIAQRYNRPRLQRLHQLKSERARKRGDRE